MRAACFLLSLPSFAAFYTGLPCAEQCITILEQAPGACVSEAIGRGIYPARNLGVVQVSGHYEKVMFCTCAGSGGGGQQHGCEDGQPGASEHRPHQCTCLGQSCRCCIFALDCHFALLQTASPCTGKPAVNRTACVIHWTQICQLYLLGACTKARGCMEKPGSVRG